MPAEENLPAEDHATAALPTEIVGLDDDGEEVFPPADAAGGDRSLPPTREEFERLAAEVRRLSERCAHERA